MLFNLLLFVTNSIPFKKKKHFMRQYCFRFALLFIYEHICFLFFYIFVYLSIFFHIFPYFSFLCLYYWPQLSPFNIKIILLWLNKRKLKYIQPLLLGMLFYIVQKQWGKKFVYKSNVQHVDYFLVHIFHSNFISYSN